MKITNSYYTFPNQIIFHVQKDIYFFLYHYFSERGKVKLKMIYTHYCSQKLKNVNLNQCLVNAASTNIPVQLQYRSWTTKYLLASFKV